MATDTHTAPKKKRPSVKDIAHIPAATKHTYQRAKALAAGSRPYDGDILSQPLMSLALCEAIGQKHGVKARNIMARKSLLDVPYSSEATTDEAVAAIHASVEPLGTPSFYSNDGYDNRFIKLPELFWPMAVVLGVAAALIIFVALTFSGTFAPRESSTMKTARGLCSELRDCH